MVALATAAVFAGCGEETATGPADEPVNAGPDTIPPAAINSLIVQTATNSTLALQWVAPGDDGDSGQAAAYDIRHFDELITEDNWDSAIPLDQPPAPKPGGTVEVLVVKNLYSARDYYFAIKTRDEVPNESAVSNCDSGTTLPEHLHPSPVTDLEAQAVSDTEYLLTWTASGDDGLSGQASVYDIRYDDTPVLPSSFADAIRVIGEPVPRPSGQPDSMYVDGLAPGTNHFFAMRVGDELPNWSSISNLCIGLALSESFLVYPASVTSFDDPVLVAFRTQSDTQVAKITVSTQQWTGSDWVWVVERHLVEQRYARAAYVVEWDYLDDDGLPVSWSFQQLQIDFYLDDQLIGSQSLRKQ